jgi:hypothetical protein
MDPRLFQRDQPRIRRLLEWDGRLVVAADRFYLLDPARGWSRWTESWVHCYLVHRPEGTS